MRFKAFKSGDDDALEELLQSEKNRLFDYIMRMTGQLSRSLDATTETINVVMPVADHEESLEDLLVVLYKTARNFSLDIWNADTSRLENSAYGTSNVDKGDKSISSLLALEHIIRSLPPKQREILILHERLGFSPDEIADITSYPVGEVEEIFAQALGVTEAALTGDAEKVPEFMTKIYSFPIPEADEQVTQNLSMVFKDLKKSSKSTPGGVLKLMMGILLVIMIGLAMTHYESTIQILGRLFQP